MPSPYAFLATALGGHTADPAARCPFCGAAVGTHRGVDLGGGWFPMRAIVCDLAAEAAEEKERAS